MKTKIRIELELEDSVLAQYDGLAEAAGLTLNQLITEHLTATRNWIGDRSAIHLSDAQALIVKQRLGAKISTPERLLDMIERLTSWKVGGLKIKLTPNQQDQIRWYARSAGKPIDEIGPMLVERAIARELKTR